MNNKYDKKSFGIITNQMIKDFDDGYLHGQHHTQLPPHCGRHFIMGYEMAKRDQERTELDNRRKSLVDHGDEYDLAEFDDYYYSRIGLYPDD